nr:type II toxin-antitoxin system RelE/ParE family toxin [Enhygromyxa salina]
MRLELTPRARAEVMEATAWYLEEGDIEVGLRFAEELDRTFDRIATNPLAWTHLERGIRRALVQGFPYAVLYCVEAERVEVFAVMHQRRHPDRWER